MRVHQLMAPLIAAALLGPACLAAASQPVSAPLSIDAARGTGNEELRYAPGELIVQLKSSVSVPSYGARSAMSAGALGAGNDSLARVLEQVGARDYQPLARPQDKAPRAGARALSGAVQNERERLDNLVKLTIDGDVQHALEALRGHPDVEFAEPNYIARPAYTPNDPYYSRSNSWGQTHRDLWGLPYMNMASAWDLAQGRGIVVAVIDTGVDVNHEDIAANVWRNPNEIPGNGIDDDGNGYIDDVTGWDFAYDDNLPDDRHGHGTHVAGTIAAVGNNGIGIIGVAPQARIMALKGLTDAGPGYYSDLIAALIYAADMGAHVINNSWGSNDDSQALREAMRYAHDRGSVVIAAAGNDNEDAAKHTPSNIDTVISVGALRHTNVKAGFSNYGPDVDVYAPGEAILSLAAHGSPVAGGANALQGKYAPLSGTSMAAPHVAGVVALILERFPTLAPEQVRYLLRNTASELGDPGWDRVYAFGAVAPAAALPYSTPLPRLHVGIHSPKRTSFGQNDRSSNYGRDRFSVTGSVGGPDFNRFELAYAPMSGALAFTVIASGQHAADNDLLGEFDTSNLPDGRYLLRLRSRDSAGRSFETFQEVIKDSSLLPGWPVSLGNTGSDYMNVVIIADLDGDGRDEFITSSGAYLFAWDEQGQPLPGFPKQLGTVEYEYGWGASVGTPSVGDLDGDGDLEIVVHVTKQIFRNDSGASIRPLEAFHHTGEPVAGFPAAAYPLEDMPENLTRLRLLDGGASPVLADLDGDGRDEIVLIQGSEGFNPRYLRVQLTVVGGDGETRAGWPQFISSETSSPERAPAVADLDGDGLKEIVVFDRRPVADAAGGPESSVTVYGHDGLVEARRRFPQGENVFYYSREPDAPVVIADIDADGRKELLVDVPRSTQVNGQWEHGYALHVMDASLTDLPGWPRTDLKLFHGVLLTDLDGQPGLEFVDVRDDGWLHAFDRKGNALPGYPSRIGPSAVYHWGLVEGGLEVAGASLFISTMTGRTDAGVSFEGLVAFDKHGQMLPGYPKDPGMAPTSRPVTAKPGTDSTTIAYKSRGNTLYAFRHAGTPRSGWTQFQGNPGHTGEDSREYPPASCAQFTATNAQHVSAGRAYTVTTGTWWKITTYYATGSKENLGTVASTQVTLAETAPGHFKKGSCPAPVANAPQVASLFGQTNAAGELIASGSAWDADGDLARVEVQLDNETTWRQASGTMQWSANLGTVAAGAHTLKARAVDAGGRVSAVRGPVSVTVTAQSAPRIDYISVDVRGRTAAVQGGASDPDGNLDRVEVQLDNGAWRLAEGSEWWSLTLSNLTTGPHTLTARATDRSGLAAVSTASFEVLADIAPVCTESNIVLDSTGTHYAWLGVSDDNNDIVAAEARVDSGSWKPGVFYFGYIVQMEDQPGELAPGAHTLYGRVIDSAGLSSECPPLSFQVAAPTDPTVDGLSVYVEAGEAQTTAHINGQASDPNRDIVSVELELDGSGTWIAADGSEGFFYAWTNPPAGQHSVRARAIDSRGGISAVFGPVSFEVGAAASAPQITALNVLLDGQKVTVRGGAADADGDLSRVEVEFDGNGQWLLATGKESWTYFTTSLASGSHSVKARAFDQGGRESAVYGPIGFSIAANAPVIDSLSASVSGQQVTVSGTASDVDGDLLRVEVEFDGDGQWLAATGSASFSYAHSSLNAGNHSVRARGVDAGNRTGAPSAPVTFTIAASAQCVTAANSAHATAGRATVKYVNLYYANGSNDYLGLAANVSSLEQQSAGVWKKVAACQ